MVERRWLVCLGPPVVAAVAAGLLASVSIGAADQPWDPPPCPGGLASLSSAVTVPDPTADANRPVPDAWFTLDPLLDGSGTLAGQRLRAGLGSQRTRHVDLPPESSAAGPFGRLILVVADDERRSEIRAIDRRAGCAWRLGASTDVIRRVTLDPAAGAVFEFRVHRSTRADLGVWRRPLDGSAVRRVLGPLTADARFGRTFSTTLGWTSEGDRLVVQSCGAVQCRTRLVELSTGRVVVLLDPGQGELVGVAGGHAIGYGACDARPCPILTTDIASGQARPLAGAAGLASLVTTPIGPRVATDTVRGAEVHRLDGAIEQTVGPPEAGLRLVPSSHGAASGTGVPPGWLAWAPDGRSPDGAMLTRLSDGQIVRLAEVTP